MQVQSSGVLNPNRSRFNKWRVVISDLLIFFNCITMFCSSKKRTVYIFLWRAFKLKPNIISDDLVLPLHLYYLEIWPPASSTIVPSIIPNYFKPLDLLLSSLRWNRPLLSEDKKILRLLSLSKEGKRSKLWKEKKVYKVNKKENFQGRTTHNQATSKEVSILWIIFRNSQKKLSGTIPVEKGELAPRFLDPSNVSLLFAQMLTRIHVFQGTDKN